MPSDMPTVLTNAQIDLSPEGIKITLPALDRDLANLIHSAVDYTVNTLENHSFDTANVEIISKKRITFTDKEEPTP